MIKTSKTEFYAELKEQTTMYGEQKRIALENQPIRAANKERSALIAKTVKERKRITALRMAEGKKKGMSKDECNGYVARGLKEVPENYVPRVSKVKLNAVYDQKIKALYWEKQGLKEREPKLWHKLITELETAYPTTRITVARYVWFDYCNDYPRNSFEIALDEFLNDEQDVLIQPTHDDVSVALWKIGYPAYDAWNRYMEVKEPEEESDDCLLEAEDLALVFA